jgi:hypothetical protein
MRRVGLNRLAMLNACSCSSGIFGVLGIVVHYMVLGVVLGVVNEERKKSRCGWRE